jgi:hypothetical protein
MKNVAHSVLVETYENVRVELKTLFDIYNRVSTHGYTQEYIERTDWKGLISEFSHQSYVLKKSIRATSRAYSSAYN